MYIQCKLLCRSAGQVDSPLVVPAYLKQRLTHFSNAIEMKFDMCNLHNALM